MRFQTCCAPAWRCSSSRGRRLFGEDSRASFPEYTQEIFDREMEYAIEAGLDYFAYVWYLNRL